MNKISLIKDEATRHRLGREQLTQWLDGLWRGHEPKPTDDLACLIAPLLQACGWQGDAHALHDVLPTPAASLSLDDLLGMMAALGYRIEQTRGALNQIPAGSLPALYMPASPRRRPMVLIAQTQDGLKVDRGNNGHEAFEDYRPEPLEQGRLYTFTRDDQAGHDATETKQPWLKSMVQRLRPLLWHAALLSLAMHVFSLAMPLFSMAVYDRVIAAHAPDTMPLLVIGMAGAFAAEAFLRGIRGRVIGWVSARAELVICQSLFERLMFLPPALIEQASVSSQLARIRAFEAVRDFVSGPMFLMALELPFICVLALAMAFFAGPVALVPVAMVGAYVLLLLLFRPHWQRLGADLAHSAAARQQLQMEIIDHAKQLYVSGASERLMQRYNAVSRQASQLQNRYSFTISTLQSLASFLTVAAAIVTINWCLDRIWAGEMSGGAMVASMIITWRLLYPLQALCNIVPNYEQVRASVRQVAQLMSLQPETHAWRHALGRRALQGTIEFQNIGLRYNRKTDPVFLGLNARIKQGEIVAVYGGNGCGKSSVLRLLLGLYAPAMGMIRIDGIDHRQLDPRTLRRHIAYLPQVPQFLPGTVADNIRLSNPAAADYQLRQAILWADAQDLIDALPQGIETVVTGQDMLSSGLSARLMLARLYLSEQPIVLCDELPPQILNSTTGDRFRTFVEECRGKRTLFFVTHREDWLGLADQVIWLKPESVPVVGRPAGRPPAAGLTNDLPQLNDVMIEAELVADEEAGVAVETDEEKDSQ